MKSTLGHDDDIAWRLLFHSNFSSTHKTRFFHSFLPSFPFHFSFVYQPPRAAHTTPKQQTHPKQLQLLLFVVWILILSTSHSLAWNKQEFDIICSFLSYTFFHCFTIYIYIPIPLLMMTAKHGLLGSLTTSCSAYFQSLMRMWTNDEWGYSMQEFALCVCMKTFRNQ